MPFIDGIGDELVYAALFAAPIVIIFGSFFGSFSIAVFKQGVSFVRRWVSGFRNIMWGRGNTSLTGVSAGHGYLSNMIAPPENDCCSICHDSFTLPCQANCAHWFCGDCILRVWQHTSALQPCKCPICRQPINVLIPFEAARGQIEYPEGERVLREIANYNRIHGEGSWSFLQRVRDMPLLLRRMLQDLMDPQRALPLVHRTRIIVYLVLLAFYIFSPLDILPEVGCDLSLPSPLKEMQKGSLGLLGLWTIF